MWILKWEEWCIIGSIMVCGPSPTRWTPQWRDASKGMLSSYETSG